MASILVAPLIILYLIFGYLEEEEDEDEEFKS